MRPFCHKLRRNEGNEHPRHMVFVDTETMPEPIEGAPNKVIHKFRIGCIIVVEMRGYKIYADDPRIFRSPEKFWHVLDTVGGSKDRPWVFAHGLCFDLTVLKFWEQIENGKLRIEGDSGVLGKGENLGG